MSWLDSTSYAPSSSCHIYTSHITVLEYINFHDPTRDNSMYDSNAAGNILRQHGVKLKQRILFVVDDYQYGVSNNDLYSQLVVALIFKSQ